MWLECGRNVPNSHIFWNVAGTFQNYIYSGMWQERGKDVPPSRLFFNVAGTCSCNVPQYTFCWNVTGVLSLNVAGTFQHHVLYERGRHVSEQHSKITSVGTWQECFFNVEGTFPNHIEFQRHRNVAEERSKIRCLKTWRERSFGVWQERSKTTFNLDVAGTWQER